MTKCLITTACLLHLSLAGLSQAGVLDEQPWVGKIPVADCVLALKRGSNQSPLKGWVQTQIRVGRPYDNHVQSLHLSSDHWVVASSGSGRGHGYSAEFFHSDGRREAQFIAPIRNDYPDFLVRRFLEGSQFFAAQLDGMNVLLDDPKQFYSQGYAQPVIYRVQKGAPAQEIDLHLDAELQRARAEFTQAAPQDLGVRFVPIGYLKDAQKLILSLEVFDLRKPLDHFGVRSVGRVAVCSLNPALQDQTHGVSVFDVKLPAVVEQRKLPHTKFERLREETVATPRLEAAFGAMDDTTLLLGWKNRGLDWVSLGDQLHPAGAQLKSELLAQTDPLSTVDVRTIAWAHGVQSGASGAHYVFPTKDHSSEFHPGVPATAVLSLEDLSIRYQKYAEWNQYNREQGTDVPGETLSFLRQSISRETRVAGVIQQPAGVGNRLLRNSRSREFWLKPLVGGGEFYPLSPWLDSGAPDHFAVDPEGWLYVYIE